VVTSLSGDLRYGGYVTRRGYDLWKQEINKQGGIEVGGEKYNVQLVYADAKSQPSTGADAASKMISNEKVDAVLGPYSSNVTLSVAPIMDKNEMPHITGSAESPDVWKKQFKYTFGTIPTVSVTADKVAETLLKLKPNAESVYVTGVNEPFSKSTAEAMKTGAKKAGVNVLGYDLYPRNTDYTNVVSKAKSKSPDFHMHGGHISSHVKLMKAAKQLDYNPNGFFMHYGVNTSSYKDGLKADAKDTFGATLWLPQVKRSGGVLFGTPQKYTDAAKAAYNSAPDYTQAASTAAGIVYQEALKKLGSKPPLSKDDRKKLIDILENLKVQTFYGTVDFETSGDRYHDNLGTEPLAIQLQDNLDPKIVGPKDVAEAEADYPVPAWNAR